MTCWDDNSGHKPLTSLTKQGNDTGSERNCFKGHQSAPSPCGGGDVTIGADKQGVKHNSHWSQGWTTKTWHNFTWC